MIEILTLALCCFVVFIALISVTCTMLSSRISREEERREWEELCANSKK